MGRMGVMESSTCDDRVIMEVTPAICMNACTESDHAHGRRANHCCQINRLLLFCLSSVVVVFRRHQSHQQSIIIPHSISDKANVAVSSGNCGMCLCTCTFIAPRRRHIPRRHFAQLRTT